jgi:hypothetical protein
MPEEIKQEGATPEEKVAEVKTETVETKVTESAEDLARRLRNKEEEAARLHKKVEKFEADEETRKKAAMSETERLQKERDEALQTAAELKTKQAQRDAAEKVGLPTAFADRIKGDTPEAMEADAKMLLENMPKAPKKPGPTPASSPAEGGQATTDDERRKFLFG